jgi:EmrB/QacA subfamily drug resistance transporter
MLGSLLAGLSWSIGALITFRVLQGLGGGMIMPLGQTILARAAGPQRLGRVMSIVGIPMFLAPISGPVIGGALIGAASWRWIFFVNLPVGALALALALWLLPSVSPRPTERLDVRGLGLLSGGIVLFVYGLATIGSSGTISDPTALGSMAGGLVLAGGFWWHALRTANPLIDVRLFAQRGFATAAIATLVLGVALFGAMLLLPLYYQIVRGQSPLDTGILLIPQGLGAAVALPLAGMLTDRIGARRVVPAAIGLALMGVTGYTQITASTPFWFLASALFVLGAGLGAMFTPLMAVAFQGLTHQAMPRATSAINVIQRLAGSLGTALLAVVLQRSIATQLPGFHGDLAQASALAVINPTRTTPALAHAFGMTFWVAFGLTTLALIPALLLPKPPRRERR